MNKLLIPILLMTNLLFASNLEKDKKEIFKVLKNYATSIACNTSFDYNEPSLEIVDFGKDDNNISYYYVLWSGDVLCYGGSGTISNYISEIFRYEDQERFFVNNTPIFDDKYLSNLKKVDNSLEITVHSYNENNSLGHPTLIETYILTKDDLFGKWSYKEK